MHTRIRSTLTASLAVTGLGWLALSAAPIGAATAPTWLTISPAVVNAALGGSPGTPGSSTSTNSFDGYKATVLSCTYSPSINISYSTPATVADFNLALATLKRATSVTMVSGIGNGAFSGTGTNTVSAYNTATKKTTMTTVKTEDLRVLVTGKTFFAISASNVTVGQEETLAKEMVPRV